MGLWVLIFHLWERKGGKPFITAKELKMMSILTLVFMNILVGIIIFVAGQNV